MNFNIWLKAIHLMDYLAFPLSRRLFTRLLVPFQQKKNVNIDFFSIIFSYFKLSEYFLIILCIIEIHTYAHARPHTYIVLYLPSWANK